MLARRGFFGKLAGLLGLAALPVRSDTAVKAAEPEPIEIKKETVTELPNGWAVQYSYQRGSQKMTDLPSCCFPDADFRPPWCPEIMQGPKVNTLMFGNFPPGTVKIGEPVPDPDCGWIVAWEYRAQGWKDETGEA